MASSTSTCDSLSAPTTAKSSMSKGCAGADFSADATGAPPSACAGSPFVVDAACFGVSEDFPAAPSAIAGDATAKPLNSAPIDTLRQNNSLPADMNPRVMSPPRCPTNAPQPPNNQAVSVRPLRNH